MKEFSAQSGPWVGMSMQEGFRIGEKILLRIYDKYLRGEGTDSDGDFLLDGNFDPATNEVVMTRRYIKVTRPNQSQVGYPFIYVGKWDGMMVSGRWFMSDHPQIGDVFEMWPEREEDLEERRIRIEEFEQILVGPRS